MDEEKLGRAIGEGMAAGQAAIMEKLNPQHLVSSMQQGFYVEIPPAKLATLMRERAKELRAELEEERRVRLSDTAIARLRANGARRGFLHEDVSAEDVRKHVEQDLRAFEQQIERLDFYAEHVKKTDDPYRLTPCDISSLLLEERGGPRMARVGSLE